MELAAQGQGYEEVHEERNGGFGERGAIVIFSDKMCVLVVPATVFVAPRPRQPQAAA